MIGKKKPRYTSDQIRSIVALAVDRAWEENLGVGEYRGYRFLGLGWAVSHSGFRSYAYMAKSPLHPKDMMFVDFRDIDDWRDYVNPTPATAETIAANTVLSMKKLIDTAHDDPEKFKATVAMVDPLLI